MIFSLKSLSLAALASTALAMPTTLQDRATNAKGTGILLDEDSLAAFQHLPSVPPSSFQPVARDAFDADLAAREIIGTDNRVVYNMTIYPYNTMVRIEFGFVVCSGVLIGPRHVATSRTCAPQYGTVPGGYKFSPNYYNGDRFPTAGFINWYMLPVGFGDCAVKDDWAIFILDQRLGDQQGYLGAKTFDASTQLNKAQFFHFGWGKDNRKVPVRQEAISVKSIGSGCEPVNEGSLRTDADVDIGQLGGPLWAVENGDRFVYGVLQQELANNQGYSPFAGGSNFVAAVGKTRADYP